MPDERTSPSSGWQEVYDAMETNTSAEGPANPCPDCGAESRRIFRRVFECEEHGVWALDKTGTPRIGTSPKRLNAD
ncbi:hypothetical protein SAMN05421858_2747 [Haladaptatus litoreus]|uniref:Transposase zinc-ribbon domain-containing protein n=1 Tax=Haladaptatus litoreus TaxID=553468 RepID=A0A1N7BTC8_9EURY|nr:hypothetical protein [Haladaptatus litoreus]SIR54595.1 hypothetical protein SAMN05421858_2747 [Haladaptatus litoreus]